MRPALTLLALTLAPAAFAADRRPNVVWIVAEDFSPNLGCYGDPDAVTPNLDKFAKQGARFTRCFTHAPVCAPSRSGLITGQYPTTLGSHHMRSKLTTPPPLFVDGLRKAGYFVAWPGKTDFNFDPPAHWADSTKNWVPNANVLPADKPFFAYVNIGVTHESQARASHFQYAKNTARLKPEQRHDPAKVTLPPYYPDTWEVRDNVAVYHDNATAMDYTVGDILKALDDRKLSDNTVVFFFGDHGSCLPRGKRWLYDSGIRVPLLVRWPGKIEPGSVREDLVCFLDFAPSVLNIAGAEVPKAMVGRAMLGDKPQPAPRYVFSCRDRMDESYDRIRSVRGERFHYLCNFHPELPYAQWINYMDEMPVMRAWRRLAFEGKLTPTQSLFMARAKPKEELYDTQADPHEVKNLAGSKQHAAALAEMRAALDQWIKDTKDLGEVPEKELIKRGVVKDVLTAEYDERVKLHPKTPPVPEK
jgi:N-sulfoglucosamine sulfohydrolase